MKAKHLFGALSLLILICFLVWTPFTKHHQTVADPEPPKSNPWSWAQATPDRKSQTSTSLPLLSIPDSIHADPCLSKRWQQMWSQPAARNDPGRIWIAQQMIQLKLPEELAIEIGNAAWEQVELKRIAEVHGPFAPEAVAFVGGMLSSARRRNLSSLGYNDIEGVWSNLLATPVASPVQAPPPMLGFSEESTPQNTNRCSDLMVARYNLASDFIKMEFSEFHQSCADWLDRLGYHPESTPYYLRRVAEDLRDIWVCGMNSEDLDPTYHGMRPLPHSVYTSDPPHGRPFFEQTAWLYRVMAIKYIVLQGGPTDERFYQDVYSQAMVGFLPPL